MATNPIVLPHGMNQHAPAIQNLVRSVIGGAPRRRKKKATAASAARRRKRTRTSSKSASTHKRSRSRGSRAHLVKGSLAAKRRMAALRKMRGKKAA
jgi:hypothetical protein